nr:uncharacterized protein LOC563780 isoform X1 [Danio rerio]XP_021335461.1 uncharacterized protein LOC563780 isoform X1 [Danio rerio]|eukprot:XP_021328144.1 uncharacterized protein LOC563780 isoform X1 [Danio rerio]
MENSDRWTDGEVQALLNFYAREEMQRDFEGNKRNTKIFACISAQLAALGINHTAKQCREKIKKLKQDYKRIKDYNNQSGLEPKTSKWYQLLDAILGHRPAYAGTRDSAVGLLDTMSPESFSLPAELKAEDTSPECSLMAEEHLIADAHMISTTTYSTPSCPSSPPSVRPGKRKRGDASVLSLVKEMMEQEEENRRQSYMQMQILVDMLKEQVQREVEERERLREEAAEARHQQAAFMESLLTTVNRLVAGAHSLRLPEPVTKEVGCQCDAPIMKSVGVQADYVPKRPKRRSKAIQVRPSASVSCSDEEFPVKSEASSTLTPIKRPRVEDSSDGSSCCSEDPPDDTQVPDIIPEEDIKLEPCDSSYIVVTL